MFLEEQHTMKRSINFKKGVERLLSLTAEDIKELAETLILEDESSALDTSVILNLEYGFPRSALAKKGQKCELGKLCSPESGIADGDDLEYAEGMPAILLTHFKTREFKGENSQGAECAAPSISLNKDGVLVSLGITGYKYGACDNCPRNVYDETVDMSLKCMSLNRFVVLTVYPDSTGEYHPVLMQFKGDGARSTPLKNALTKIINELGGKVYGNLVSVDTVEEPGTYTDKVTKKVEKFTKWLYTFAKVKDGALKPELKSPLLELKNKLLNYYYEQHMMRIRLYADQQRPDVKETDLLENNAPADESRQIEDQGTVIDAKTDDGFSL